MVKVGVEARSKVGVFADVTMETNPGLCSFFRCSTNSLMWGFRPKPSSMKTSLAVEATDKDRSDVSEAEACRSTIQDA